MLLDVNQNQAPQVEEHPDIGGQVALIAQDEALQNADQEPGQVLNNMNAAAIQVPDVHGEEDQEIRPQVPDNNVIEPEEANEQEEQRENQEVREEGVRLGKGTDRPIKTFLEHTRWRFTNLINATPAQREGPKKNLVYWIEMYQLAQMAHQIQLLMQDLAGTLTDAQAQTLDDERFLVGIWPDDWENIINDQRAQKIPLVDAYLLALNQPNDDFIQQTLGDIGLIQRQAGRPEPNSILNLREAISFRQAAQAELARIPKTVNGKRNPVHKAATQKLRNAKSREFRKKAFGRQKHFIQLLKGFLAENLPQV